MTGRTLVAGVGNVFLGDDGFGVEVARLLAQRPWPDGVEIADFGIRGVHLVYELLDGCDLFVLIDAAPRGYEPGTVTVLEVDLEDMAPGVPGVPDALDVPDAPDAPAVAGVPIMDAHGLSPDDIFAMLASMGGRPGRSLLVACEPADVNAGMELSEPVRAALPHAVRAVEEILGELAMGQKEGVRDAAQTGHGGGRSRPGLPGGSRAARH